MGCRRSVFSCVLITLTFADLFHVTEAIRPPTLDRRQECGTNTSWNPSVEAWVQANTDENLSLWWNNTVAEVRGATLANQLARQFGAQQTDFSCGIEDEGSCVTPGCQVYMESGDEPWMYLALCSVVNLDTFLNRLWQGVRSGQQDFSDDASALAQTFFPWKDPKFGASDAAIWIEATIGALFTFINPETRLVSVGTRVMGDFVSAGSQEVELQLRPNPDLTLLQGISVLTEAAGASAEKARAAIANWASTLFSGQQDSLNNTLLHYLKNGSFIAPPVYTDAEFEQYWKWSLISRTINSQWATRPNFVTFARTSNRSIDIGPEVSKYYSNASGGVYYTYQWKQGRLDYPDGMMELPNPPWSIQPWEATESSALAFEVAGFNYTPSISLNRLKASLFNSSLNPAVDGAHSEGLWTLPVCNMSDHVQWNGQYGKDRMAPCCCGHECRDTKTFVALANLKGDQSYLKQCRSQLTAANIAFSHVDYGFQPQQLSNGAIAGIAIGSAAGVLLLTCLCRQCCICRRSRRTHLGSRSVYR